MANEIQAPGPSACVLYAVLRSASGQAYNTSPAGLETYQDAHWSTYALTMAEQGTSGYYVGSMPGGLAAGLYSVDIHLRAAGTAALGDQRVAAGALVWTGSAEAFVVSDSSGRVTVGTNADKAGYTASTVQDKTGYTVSTVQDKTGYALSSGEHTAISGTDVPAALTAQGYTSTRAGYLDTLNGLVAAVWGALTSGLTTSGSIGVLLSKLGFDGSNNVRAVTQAYAAGQDPATLLLLTAANKLRTNASGQVQLDLAQAVPTSNTAQTVGDALNAARAGNFGKWTLSGTTLRLYAADGTTVVRQFTLDSALTPTMRS